MKAIIFPTDKSEKLGLLTAHIPEYLLPIVNKPIVEHLVELLVRNGIKDIILVVRHMHDETERYFGNGERWGVNISYSLEPEYCGINASLNRISSKLDESFLCMPGNVITNLDISGLIKSHESSNAGITISKQTNIDDTPFLSPLDRTEEPNEFLPFIMTPQALFKLSLNDKILNIKQAIATLVKYRTILNTYYSSCDFKAIQSLDDYWESNKHILKGYFKGIIIPGKELQKGIWIGRKTRIHPNVKMESPLLIGDYCKIRKESIIGEKTIIGNNVLVDQNAFVKESIILDNSYIGSHTEIKESIVWKKYLLNVPRFVKTFVMDDFILGNMERSIEVPVACKLFNIITASIIMALFLPVTFILYLYHLISPSKGFFETDEQSGNIEIIDLDGNRRPKSFNLYSFKCKFHFLHILPGLHNVIKEDKDLLRKPSMRSTKTLYQ